MSRRAAIVFSVIAAGLSSGCGRGSELRVAPTAPSPEQQAGAGDNVARPPQPPPDPPPPTGTCVPEPAQWAVGRAASPALLDRARIDATASIARFIRPNEAVTMEFSPARLNLHLDDRGVVRSVTCG